MVAGAEPSPGDVLAQHGLLRLGATNIWINRLEHDLRANLDALPEHRQAIALLDEVLAQRIEQNARQFVTAQQTEASLNATLRNAQLDDAARRQINGRLTTLRSRMIPPADFGNHPETRQQLITLIGRRHALWLSLAAIRRDATQVSESYLALAQRPAIQNALKQLGPTQRLGPAKNYLDELPKLADYEALVLTDWVPVYHLAGRPRVSSIVNETTPVTFSWTSSPEATLLTASAAEAAGIEIPVNAPTMRLTLSKDRNVTARRVTIPYLRMGKHLLRDVDAYVLPTEGEDFGSRMSVSAFTDVRCEEQWERLRLVLSPRN